MKCPRCNKEDAVIDSVYGILPGKKCQDEDKQIKKPSFQGHVEFTSRTVKEHRKKYKDDILQPFVGGHLSKEYINKYGTEGLSVTKQDIKEAKWTNKDELGWRPNE